MTDYKQPMTDYKQLCAELVNELHAYKIGNPSHDTDLIDRARAALAEPEPEVPTDEEIIAFWADHCAGDGDTGIIRLARWGRPAPQPVPVSERLPGVLCRRRT